MNYHKIIYTLSLVFPIMMSGCTANAHLTPEGEKVMIYTSQPPKNCEFIGEVNAYDRNGVSQSYQSHEHLIKDGQNILRNKAAELGANTLIISKHNQTYTGNPKNDFVDEHRMTALAYKCKMKQ